MKKSITINCKQCGKSHDKNEVARSLGKESSPYQLGFCSAQCFTENITNPKPKYLVVENDNKLGRYFEKYLIGEKIEANIIFDLEFRTTEEIAELFTQYDILLFEPTMITFSQYNGLMMLMYDLLTKGILKIKEIHLYHHDERIERELRGLWYGKRKFLDLMLPHLKIYRIDDIENQKIEINL